MSLPHILLGMLSTPASGYEIKKSFDDGARHYWAAELSQIYPALKRLEQAGHLTSATERSPRGPDRRIYERTDAGRDHLLEWLRDGPAKAATRMAYVAQLEFMHEIGNLDHTAAFIADLRNGFAALSHVLTEGEKGYQNILDTVDDQGFHEFLVLGLGARTLRARIDWCDDALDSIDRRRKRQGESR